MRLEGKVALITGAARGQGAAEARMFAQEGAKVVLADVSDQEGTAVAAEIAESGGDQVANGGHGIVRIAPFTNDEQAGTLACRERE